MDVKLGAVVDLSEIPAQARPPRKEGKYAAVYEKFGKLEQGKCFPLEFPSPKLAIKAGSVLRQQIRRDGGIVVIRGCVIWVGRPVPPIPLEDRPFEPRPEKQPTGPMEPR